MVSMHYIIVCVAVLTGLATNNAVSASTTLGNDRLGHLENIDLLDLLDAELDEDFLVGGNSHQNGVKRALQNGKTAPTPAPTAAPTAATFNVLASTDAPSVSSSSPTAAPTAMAMAPSSAPTAMAPSSAPTAMAPSSAPTGVYLAPTAAPSASGTSGASSILPAVSSVVVVSAVGILTIFA